MDTNFSQKDANFEKLYPHFNDMDSDFCKTNENGDKENNSIEEMDTGSNKYHVTGEKYHVAGEKYMFSSTFSTYLTALGYSIGMSDIWRFPFLAFRNGGGAFLIPFFTMIVICGIPMYFLEYSIGKFSGKGPYKVWDISPLFRGIGITISIAYAVYMAGSSIFRVWIIDLFINTFRDPLPWSHCNNVWNTDHCRTDLVGGLDQNATIHHTLNATRYEYFNTTNVSVAETTLATVTNGTQMSAAEEYWQYNVLHLSPGVEDMYPVIWRYFLYMAALRLVIFLGSIKSVKSIEKVIYVTGTVPFVLTVAVFIRSAMLPGFGDGVKYFFYPDFFKLTKPKVWIEATLMAFYTLGFGWGATVLIGSHAAFKDNSLRTAIILPLVDSLVAAFSGMVCFCVLGNMAYTQGIHITEVINAGMAAGVVSYITALSVLPVPQIWSALFLLSLFLTGMEAQLIPIDMIMQLIGDCFPRLHANSRVICLGMVSIIIYLLSLCTCTGAGAYIFLWTDWYSGAWVGPIVAFVEIIVVAWIYGMDRFDRDIKLMIGRHIPGLLRIVTAFISPLIVAVIFFISIVNYVPPRYGSYIYPTSARILGWIAVLLIILPILIKAGVVLYRSSGTFCQRIKAQLRPNEHWGPCEEELYSIYQEEKHVYKNRTFKDLLHYNVFGSYPKSSAINLIKASEMQSMRGDL